jgi:hypothetical protein
MFQTPQPNLCWNLSFTKSPSSCPLFTKLHDYNVGKADQFASSKLASIQRIEWAIQLAGRLAGRLASWPYGTLILIEESFQSLKYPMIFTMNSLLVS